MAQAAAAGKSFCGDSDVARRSCAVSVNVLHMLHTRSVACSTFDRLDARWINVAIRVK